MPINLHAFRPSELKTVEVILTEFERNGVMDSRFIRQRLNGYIAEERRKARVSSVSRDERQKIKAWRKDMARRVKQAHPCPSCGGGVLLPVGCAAARGTLNCSADCGYSTMERS